MKPPWPVRCKPRACLWQSSIRARRVTLPRQRGIWPRRIGSMRCHAQAVTVKLPSDIPLPEIERVISEANPWVRVVPNEREASERFLTPAHVSGTLEVPVGRLHKLVMGGEYLAAFTCGDQLLWGAAEPLRRMLAILLD